MSRVSSDQSDGFRLMLVVHDDPRLTHPAVIGEALPEIRYFQHVRDNVIVELIDSISTTRFFASCTT